MTRATKKNEGLRDATCCENCVFSGFKAAYHGGKRVTGLCLHYQSTPQINYNFSPDNWPQLMHWFHNLLRSQSELNPPTFEQVVAMLPEQRNLQVYAVYINYLKQKGRELPQVPYSYPLHNQWIQGQNGGLLWVDGLPDDLELSDWPRIVAHYHNRGGWINIHKNYRQEPVLDVAAATNQEIVEPLRMYYDEIVKYHTAWRDYFTNTPIQKIKRSTVCDNHKPVIKKTRVNKTDLVIKE